MNLACSVVAIELARLLPGLFEDGRRVFSFPNAVRCARTCRRYVCHSESFHNIDLESIHFSNLGSDFTKFPFRFDLGTFIILILLVYEVSRLERKGAPPLSAAANS